MSSPTVSDHVWPTDADPPDGVYRVVGVGDGTVTLLRITDADRTRRHTGETVTVDAEAFAGFDPVEPPTRSRSVGAVVASSLEVGYWSLRAFVSELAAHPVATAGSLALVLVGLVGDAVVPAPDLLFGALIFAGSLGLAYVGGGRP